MCPFSIKFWRSIFLVPTNSTREIFVKLSTTFKNILKKQTIVDQVKNVMANIICTHSNVYKYVLL